MRRFTIIAALAAIVFSLASCTSSEQTVEPDQAKPEPVQPAPVEQPQAQAPAEPAPAPEPAPPAKPERPKTTRYDAQLDEILPGLASEDVPTRQAARQGFENLCLNAARPGAEEERAELCQAIIARLGDETPKPLRVWMLRLVERIGRAEYVPTLIEIMGENDVEVRDLARRGLQHNPSPEAAEALRNAYDLHDDLSWKVAIVNAVAARLEADGIHFLAERTEDDNTAICRASLAGLGGLTEPAATDALMMRRKSLDPELRAVATDALLRTAEAHIARGWPRRATVIYRDIYQNPADNRERDAGLIGLARSMGVDAYPVLLPLIENGDPDLARVAAAGTQFATSEAATLQLMQACDGAHGNARVILLDTLAERGDKRGYSAVRDALSDEDVDVRLAALAAMRKLGNGGAAVLIAERAAAGTGAERTAARGTLRWLPGADANEKMLAAFKEQASSDVRCELARALAAREYAAATPALLEAAGADDAKLRKAAYAALSELATLDNLSALVQRLIAETDADAREAAEEAVVNVALYETDQEARAEVVLNELGDTDGEVRASLVRVLGKLGGPQALAVVRASCSYEDERVVDAAVRALADWTNTEVLDDLLTIAKESKNPAHRVLAIRGYTGIVNMRSDRPASESFEMLAEILPLAERVEDKRAILGALGRVPHESALWAVEAHLLEPELQDEAGMAMLSIARALAAEQPNVAREAIKRVGLAAKLSKPVVDEAVAVAKLLEEFQAYCGTWSYVGPYSEEGKKAEEIFAVSLPPENPGKAKLVWKTLHSTNPENPWIFDLTPISQEPNCCVYVRTYIWSPGPKELNLELGSDDGIKAWLNDKLVAEHMAHRELTLGSDVVPVGLASGWNSLLLKVVQVDGGWSFCAGFRKPDGQPPKGLRFAPAPEFVE